MVTPQTGGDRSTGAVSTPNAPSRPSTRPFCDQANPPVSVGCGRRRVPGCCLKLNPVPARLAAARSSRRAISAGGRWRRRPPPIPDDDQRARRMVSAVLTNRTEQHRRERAPAAASDDEAVGPVGRLDQHRCGVSLPHAERDGGPVRQVGTRAGVSALPGRPPPQAVGPADPPATRRAGRVGAAGDAWRARRQRGRGTWRRRPGSSGCPG